ncbi:hypothetical protein [Sediminispirochaeta smaragdinae]|uniref:Lipoprotein n=1 Tax=Sediminispirochaeta smaragdinae (strain DSM 11293 / JCM 15392 / SEBR 4228) TaxID=573413 RepID=E1R824_SEDSS|nr:hypothetical protein [Sediminispirochaeta smaragdinae]ADK82879.1 hypothetical protein Spirs_3793 [Sediminispirochaeta smaragdinae DSM 11293]
MMKINTYLIPLLAPLLILIFGGCYSETVTSDNVVSLTISSKGDLGDSGDGYYLVAKFYDADVMDDLLAGDEPTIRYVATTAEFYYYYTISLPDPDMLWVDYIDTLTGSGIMTISSIPPMRYRLLLEAHNVSDDYNGFAAYAGVSDAFTVNPGETSTIAVELINHAEG